MQVGDATVDHIDPDGGDSIRNYVPSCSSCNALKGKKSVEEFRLRKAYDTLRSKLPPLKWTDPQLKWLLEQQWFPFTLPEHKFHYELEDGNRGAREREGGNG